MIAFWPSWTNHEWFTNGANVWQWVTTMVTIAGWSFVCWTYWHHRCYHCLRPGQVPIQGSVHKACKHHADKYGHAHGVPIQPPPKKGAQ